MKWHRLGSAFRLLLVSLPGLLLQNEAKAAASDRPPNIVLLFVDNVGYGDLACYGHPTTKTPNIDRLAAEGVRCMEFYIGSPSCMPSRGALLTGRHPVRNGLNEQIWKIDEMEQIGLPHRELLLPHYLKQKGYATACFGKWNIGFAPGSRPTERGLSYLNGCPSTLTHALN